MPSPFLIPGALLIALSFVGYGALVLRLYPRLIRATPSLSRPTLGDAGLLGFLCLTGVGQLLHFLVPLSAGLALGLHVFGLVACLFFGRAVLSAASRLDLLFTGVAALTVLFQGLSDEPYFTAGIYAIPAIKWNVELPVIPGLGNLHGRLAFNSSLWILGALLKLPVVAWGSVFLLNAFLALFLMAALFQHVHRALRSGRTLSLSTTYALVLLAGFCAHSFYFRGRLGSLSPDFPPAILVLYCIYLVLRFLEEGRVWVLTWAFALACLAVTIKLSALPLLIGVLVILGFGAHSLRTVERGSLVTMALIMAGLLGPWLARGLAVSGCLAYPEPRSCIGSLPWTIPDNLAINEAQCVFYCARGSQIPPRTVWDWVSPALWELGGGRLGKLVIGMVVAGLGLVGWERWGTGNAQGRPRHPESQLILVVLTSIPLAGLAFSVWKGPALRFNLGYWYGLGVLMLGWGVFRNANRFPAWDWHRLISPVLCGLLAVQGSVAGWRWARYEQARSWPRIQDAITTEMTTASGMKVLVSYGDNCWDAPLPCTPFFDATLRKVALGGRFYLKGSNEVLSCCFFHEGGTPPRK